MVLKDKKVLITRGSSGLGLSLVKIFVEKGSHVFTCARDLEKLNKEVEGLENVKTFQTDLANAKDVRKLVEEVGTIDVLVNNAGVHFGGPLINVNTDQISQVIDVNLKGLMCLTNEVVKNQKEAETHIVNISSTSGLKGRPESSIYCASKWGVRGFTESLIEEYAGTNFHVYGFYPGGMKTNLFKEGRDTSSYMNPDDVAVEIVNILEKSDKVKLDHVVINRP